MVTQNQLEKLLDGLTISACTSILDLGCGTGALTEYIADHTDGIVTAIDFSDEAVEFARERTRMKQDQLSFQVMDMDEIDFPANSFDTVLSFDTLYFVSDLDETIKAMLASLQENGQMGIFYSAKVYPGESKEKLRPENTVLAEALERCGMQYETWDFTAEEKEFWKKSLDIASKLKDQFDEEGNLRLYESSINESTRELEFFDAGGKSRYLYRAWL
jgi:ubiquinone/menaquinone biosynthesis C-methylase UbiE